MENLYIQYPLDSWYVEGADTTESICEKLLLNRRVQEDSQFLHTSLQDIPDPFIMKDMEASVALIKKAIFDKKKIMIVGDYDVDGVTATSLLLRFFTHIQVPVHFFIPNRFTHGYGITQKAADDLIAQKPDLIITVDNGIASKNEIAFLKEANIDVIVTDHHQIIEANCPDTLIINPHQEGCNYPEKRICGVAVAFLLTIALRKSLREDLLWHNRPLPNLLAYLDLVTLGTFADQMPLIGLNRIFCKIGLDQMWSTKVAEESSCYYSYLRVLRDKHKLRTIDYKAISFTIAPLLNAAGRMEEATYSLRFLMSKTYDEALEHYEKLNSFNQQRRKLQNKLFKEIRVNIEDSDQNGIFMYNPVFHEGVIGIVAARLGSTYSKPVCIVSDGEDDCYKASMRTKEGNLMPVMDKFMAPFLLRFGGHQKALGATFKREMLPQVKQAFYEGCKVHFNTQETTKPAQAEIEVNLGMLNDSLFSVIPKLAPFGNGNQQPIFAIRSLALPESRPLQGKHVKWSLEGGVEMLYWSGLKRVAEMHARCDVTFSLKANYFQGHMTREIHVQDMYPAS